MTGPLSGESINSRSSRPQGLIPESEPLPIPQERRELDEPREPGSRQLSRSAEII